MKLLKTVSRYWHTLRHLKPVQLYGRVLFRLFTPSIDASAAPPLSAPSNAWQVPVARPQSLFSPDEFEFLSVRGRLSDVGWDGPGQEKLWRYNQHYFDDLNSEAAGSRSEWHSAILNDWCMKNPPGVGTGWEPYPTSLRVVNWVKWAVAGNALPERCLHSLAVQARWLSKRLERHLLGNHLLANAKALVFVGLFFRGREADAWLRAGLDIIAAELPEQVLPDGGNFERSPMYHSIMLEDVLDLVNATEAWPDRVDAPVIDQWKATSQSMLYWLEVMTHSDGEISFFNDAAIGTAPSPSDLNEYAERLSLSAFPCLCHGNVENDVASVVVTQLRDSGYIRLEAMDAVALLDVAPIGPDYLPAHAHADTLSFELSLYGRRAIVNGGTSCYGVSSRRQYERQTSAHSTVEVDGESSSEVWGGFRVARRAKPVDLDVKAEPDVVRVVCSHDGYKRLPGRPVHRRQWEWCSRMLIVDDTVSDPTKSAISRFILHPDLRVKAVNANRVELEWDDGQVFTAEGVVGDIAMAPASYSPQFGLVRDSRCLKITLANGCGKVVFRW